MGVAFFLFSMEKHMKGENKNAEYTGKNNKIKTIKICSDKTHTVFFLFLRQKCQVITYFIWRLEF